MGMVTVLGAMLMIIGWFTLVEFDNFPESERTEIIQRIKGSPAAILLIALMPAGILINVLGGFIDSYVILIVGASLIFLQGIIVSLLFWKRTRWKSIFMLVIIVILGIFIYIP